MRLVNVDVDQRLMEEAKRKADVEKLAKLASGTNFNQDMSSPNRRVRTLRQKIAWLLAFHSAREVARMIRSSGLKD